MPSVKTKIPCSICLKNYSVMHSHHTIPQARGGKNSTQVILCATCHNQVHAKALAVISFLNNNRKSVGTFFTIQEYEDRADQFVQLLVQSLQKTENRKHKVCVELSTDTFQQLKLMQKDCSISTLEQTVKHCIDRVLLNKGYTQQLSSLPKKWYQS
jgi:hypothetical protein